MSNLTDIVRQAQDEVNEIREYLEKTNDFLWFRLDELKGVLSLLEEEANQSNSKETS